MKIKTVIKKKSNGAKKSGTIYKCEKCGYESTRTFLNIFEGIEYRYCLKCVHEFYIENFPKAVLKK